MTNNNFSEGLHHEDKDLTPLELAKAELIYQELFIKYQKDIEQDQAGTLKRVYKSMAIREVKAAKEHENLPEPIETASSKKPKKPKGEVIHFPLSIPEKTRPVSNVTVRAALFAAIQGEDRELMDEVLLASQEGIKIIFSGRQLNQDDHDVFMQLIGMASNNPLGESVEIPATAILAGLGRGKGKSQHEQLKDEIHRLVKATVNIKCNGINFIGGLIDSAYQDERKPQHKRHWNYRLNPDIAPLFSRNQYTLMDWEQRLKLKQKDLARFLHSYYASHASPFPVSVEFLRDISGSRTNELWKFRQNLKKALDALQEIGFISSWSIDKSDLVHVARTSKEAQQLNKPEATQALPAPISVNNTCLKPATIEKFRSLYVGCDPYYCKAEFDEWLDKAKIIPKNYDALFLDFAGKWKK